MARKLVVLAVFSLLACGHRTQSPLISTATQYRLCELDSHCPGAMYCSAGVCDHDCRQDSDCGAGLSCDPRGRCVTPGVPPAPPKVAGKLAASVSELALTPERNTGTFTLANGGQEPIDRFHVLSDDPEISATPAGGSIPPGGSVTVTVTVAPSYARVVGSLHVLSTGGKADLAVEWGSNLAGRLEGDVTVAAPFQLGSAPIALEIAGDPAAMTGSVDGAASLLWPANAAVTASDDGTSFVASFVIVARSGDPANPLFDVPVRRTVELRGTHEGPSAVAGTYTEAIEHGTGATFQASGSFRLRNVGVATGVTVAAQGTFATQAVAFAPACTVPLAAGCASDQGDCLFDAGFGFEQLGAVTGYDATSNVCLHADGTSVPCVDEGQVGCALASFAAAGNGDGRVDVWRARATFGLLSGQAQIAQVVQPASAAPGGNGLGFEVTELQAAVSTLQAGLHGTQGGGSLLAAADLQAALTLATVFGQPSARDDVQPAGCAQVTDLARFPGDVAATLYGGAELVDRELREQVTAGDGGVNAPAAIEDATKVAAGAFLDLAALGSILPPGAGQDPVPGLAQSFGLVVQTFRYAVKGLDAVGYPSTYVPFRYDAEHPSWDVFQQVYQYQASSGYLANLKADEQALQGDAASWESSNTQLRAAATNAHDTAASQLAQLCGAAPADGQPLSCDPAGGGGQVAQDYQSVQAALAAFGEARFRSNAAHQKIQMLDQQLSEETGDYQDDLSLQILAGNAAIAQAQDAAAQAGAVVAQQKQIDILDTAKENEATANLIDSCVNGVFQQIGSGFSALFSHFGTAGGLLGSSCVPLAAHLVDNIGGDQAGVDQATLAADQAAQATAQAGVVAAQANAGLQFQILKGQMVLQDNAMIVQITDATNDWLAGNYQMAQETALIDAAEAKLEADLAEVAQLASDWTQDQAEEREASASDATYRLYRDKDGLAWSFDMRIARLWCFLSARAFDYTMNVSSAYDSQCLEAAGESDLEAALTAMTSAYGTGQVWNNQRRDVVSLRKLLGIRGSVHDEVTGTTQSEGQQFQALLALPKYRDAGGNVEIKFSTSIDPGNGLFSTQLAMDTIQDVKVNLVGSQLAGQTGYVTLVHSGSGRLRGLDGSLTGYQLEPKTALVPAAVNDSQLATDASVPASTDLFGRPVDEPSWTLVIDQSDDPLTAQIDVSMLEDVEILFDHQGLTIQQSP